MPIIGDDIKSQVGATITHRVMAKLFEDRGVELLRTYQLNFGGNMDFMNMLERKRLVSKKISKTQSVTSQIPHEMERAAVHIGPSDHVPWLDDRKWAYVRLEGRSFGDMPLNLEYKLEVWDSPNSAGVIIDAIRAAKIAKDRGIGGPILSAVLVLHEVAARAVQRRRGPRRGGEVHPRRGRSASRSAGAARRAHGRPGRETVRGWPPRAAVPASRAARLGGLGWRVTAARGRARPRSSFVADLRIGARPSADFRQLFATRLISQAGDGVFNAGLGAYVFFSAQIFPDPAAAAEAFAVLYLPYSLIGPFAGVFIDRWSAAADPGLVGADPGGVRGGRPPLLVASGDAGRAAVRRPRWPCSGVNRFFLSSLSAALPHVVADDKLVMANSVAPTSGTIVALRRRR